ncbi:uncharacterized protein LOC120343996 isoform X1 [Styela clava]
MSSKQNITLHMEGINACESREYEQALKLFKRIAEPSAVIFFNMGCCYLKLNNFTEALKMFQQCVSKDKYLAIGYFQLAIAQTVCQDLPSAAVSFQGAIETLRGNPFIDYKQLNMTCKLYAAEINFNLGLVYLFSGDYNNAREMFHTAGGLPMDSSRHSRIPDAIDAVEAERWEYFGNDASSRLILLPENSFFRVSKAKMEGMQTSTKFIPEAKVVAAANEEYSFVGFVGAKKLQAGGNNSPTPSPVTTKRSNQVGPPPSKPPPRLGSSGASPSHSIPAPVPVKAPPARPVSPNRPPPPTAPPPNSVSKLTPPSRAPPVAQVRDMPPKKSPITNDGENVLNELKKNMDNVQLKASPITLKCEFKFNVGDKISYEDLIAEISQKLGQASSNLSTALLRKTMTLDLQEPQNKTGTAIKPDNSSSWQATLMKKRPADLALILKENDSKFPVPNRRPPSPKTRPYLPKTSPGYRPSRPAPTHSNYQRNTLHTEEDIYHDIS